jgi:hypothetical protein
MQCPLYQGHCMQCPNKSINALRAMPQQFTNALHAMPVMPAQRWDIACDVHYTRGIACNAPTNPSTRCVQCLLCPRNVGTLHAMSIIPGALHAMPQQIHQRVACNACYARATLGHCMRCPLYPGHCMQCPLYQGHCVQCPNKSINALHAMPQHTFYCIYFGIRSD